MGDSSGDETRRSVKIDEANGPISKCVPCVCHDTLPWLISFSLDDGITLRANLRKQYLWACVVVLVCGGLLVLRWENRRRTLRMFLHEFGTPGEKFLVWILRLGDRIGHEFHHCPLSFRLAHHGAVWLYLVRAIFFGGGYSGNPSPIAASSNIDLGKDNLRVPPLRKLLHRLTRAKPIQNRAAQGRSRGRRLNGIFAESTRRHDERQDKTKLFHYATLSQISGARDKTLNFPPTRFRKVWQQSSNNSAVHLWALAPSQGGAVQF